LLCHALKTAPFHPYIYTSVLKVGGITPMGAILRNMGMNKPKGVTWEKNNARG